MPRRECLTMARTNDQRRTADPVSISDEEIWSAIRYLDPELDRKNRDVIGIVAVLWIFFLLSVGGLLFQLFRR